MLDATTMQEEKKRNRSERCKDFICIVYEVSEKCLYLLCNHAFSLFPTLPYRIVANESLAKIIASSIHIIAKVYPVGPCGVKNLDALGHRIQEIKAEADSELIHLKHTRKRRN